MQLPLTTLRQLVRWYTGEDIATGPRRSHVVQRHAWYLFARAAREMSPPYTVETIAAEIGLPSSTLWSLLQQPFPEEVWLRFVRHVVAAAKER